MSFTVGSTSYTLYPEQGPASARRSYSEELGGWISRRAAREVLELGVRIEQYQQLRQSPLYWRNAEQYAAATGQTLEQAARNRDYLQASVRAADARQRQDWDALATALQDMGYNVDYLDEGGRS